MAKYYLIGIGGTGARCLEAFVHVLGAGILKEEAAEINIIHVDPDKTCGNLQRSDEKIRLYCDACKMGYGETGFFTHKISKVVPWNPVPDNEKCLDSVFNISDMKVQNISLGRLYEALFTEKERSTSLDKGFRGHPAIGASIMALPDVEKSEPWSSLLQDAKKDKDTRVFIFGSLFGGTGAAGVPNIAKLVKDIASEVKIGVGAILPYFSIPKPDEASAEELQVKSEDFVLSTKSALRYYATSKILEKTITEMYLIGNSHLAEVEKFSLGSKSQENGANIVEFYAAMAAFGFFNKTDQELADSPNNPYAINRREENSIFWEDVPEAGNNARKKLKHYIKFLYAYFGFVYQSLLLRQQKHGLFSNTMEPWMKNLKVGDKGVVSNKEIWEKYVGLFNFAGETFVWLNQIVCNGIGVKLFDKKIVDGTSTPVMKEDYDLNMLVGDSGRGSWSLHQELSHKDYKKYSASLKGEDYLMQALYEVCE